MNLIHLIAPAKLPCFVVGSVRLEEAPLLPNPVRIVDLVSFHLIDENGIVGPATQCPDPVIWDNIIQLMAHTANRHDVQ